MSNFAQKYPLCMFNESESYGQNIAGIHRDIICYWSEQDGWSAILKYLNVLNHFDLFDNYYDNEDESNIEWSPSLSAV